MPNINCYYYSFYMSSKELDTYKIYKDKKVYNYSKVDSYSKKLLYLEPLKKNGLKSHKSLYRDMDSLDDINHTLEFNDDYDCDDPKKQENESNLLIEYRHTINRVYNKTASFLTGGLNYINSDNFKNNYN